MKKGLAESKQLEELVRLIHESFRDREDTTVRINHKLKRPTGRPREFDVYVETTFHGVPFNMAIECKAYSNPVGVKEIEAFKAKCDLFPEINRRLFVSESGYQSGAVSSAADFRIELYDITSITREQLLKMLPVSQLSMVYEVQARELVIEAPEDRLERLRSQKFNEVFLGDGSVTQTLSDIINEQLKLQHHEFFDVNLMGFMQNGGTKSIGMKTGFTIGINLDRAYVQLEPGEKFQAVQLIAKVDMWFTEKPVDIVASQIYSTQGKSQAARAKIALDGSDTSDIILTKDKVKVFLTDASGKTNELQLLARYDAKTDRLTVL